MKFHFGMLQDYSEDEYESCAGEFHREKRDHASFGNLSSTEDKINTGIQIPDIMMLKK